MAKKYKLLLDSGLSFLCRHIKQIRLKADLAGEAVSQLADAVDSSLAEFQSHLAQKQSAILKQDFVIPSAGWASDPAVPEYPAFFDIAVTDLSDQDYVAVTVLPQSFQTALSARFAPVQSLSGKFRLRAETAPSQDIDAIYIVAKGG